MNILHVLNNFNQGGAEAFVYDLLLFSMRDDFNQMNGFCLIPSDAETHKERVVELEDKDISVFFGGKGFGQQFRNMRTQVRNLKPDIIHCHNLRALIVAILVRLSERGSYKLVFTQHINFLRRPFFHKFLKRWVSVYVSICKDVRSDIRRRIKRDSLYIPNGIRPFEMEKGELIGNGKINIVMVGRFQHQKAHSVFVDSLVELKKEGVIESFHFWLIGEGELKKEIEHKVQEKKVSESVTFMGNVDRARTILNRFDALLLTSWYEGLPIVVLEALYARIPVISTDVGGVKDVVVDGVNGFIAKVGDAGSIAECISKMKNEIVLRGVLENIENNVFEYTVENNYKKHCKMYKGLCGKETL